MKTVEYREYHAALTALKDRFKKDGINIYDMAWSPDGPIRLGVGWASCGAVPPKIAAKFGDRLLDAAMAAEEFLYNGYVIDYSE